MNELTKERIQAAYREQLTKLGYEETSEEIMLRAYGEAVEVLRLVKEAARGMTSSDVKDAHLVTRILHISEIVLSKMPEVDR